jgi:hypothetical protein
MVNSKCERIPRSQIQFALACPSIAHPPAKLILLKMHINPDDIPSSDVSRDGPMNSLCVVLKEHFVPQRHLAHLALETITFFDIDQMLPLKVLRQVAGCIEFTNKLFYFRIVRRQR